LSRGSPPQRKGHSTHGGRWVYIEIDGKKSNLFSTTSPLTARGAPVIFPRMKFITRDLYQGMQPPADAAAEKTRDGSWFFSTSPNFSIEDRASVALKVRLMFRNGCFD